MANTTFQGTVRSDGDLKVTTKNTTTGAYVDYAVVKASPPSPVSLENHTLCNTKCRQDAPFSFVAIAETSPKTVVPPPPSD